MTDERPTRIVRFGAGSLADLADVCGEAGITKPLLVASRRGAESVEGLPVVGVYDGVRPHVPVETVHEVSVPGLAPNKGSPAETLALKLAGRNHTATVPYGTEGGHFHNAGIATVVCGPGSIDQAHQPDEYITLADLEAGTAFMRRLAATLSG